jgi:8-amino-7-oxononanoate synthase
VKQVTPPALRFLEDGLAEAKQGDLIRERLPPGARQGICFCSNDYLDLANRPAPIGASGSGSSRLVSGERQEHVQLEQAAADLVELPEALVFSTGYAANVGLIAALAGPDDLVVSDELNHASLVDGVRLSRARRSVIRHLDLSAVDRALRERGRGNAFVVTESYFSMDADAPDLRALRVLCDTHGAALLVDEAHALGVLGPDGRGLCAEAGVRPDALVGTFGKAFGAAGAFVAGCPALMAWLWNRARTFVFSTGLSPTVAAAAYAGLRTAHDEPSRRHRVVSAAVRLRKTLADHGVRTPGFGHIVPWVIGDSGAALRAATGLGARGIDVRAIRPPSVPKGEARLRFTVTAAHSPTDIERAGEAVAAVLEQALP